MRPVTKASAVLYIRAGRLHGSLRRGSKCNYVQAVSGVKSVQFAGKSWRWRECCGVDACVNQAHRAVFTHSE